MRKIIILSFLTLDGVMQAPGGPKEDTSGGFAYGGWTYPYFDDFAGKIMAKQMSGNSDLLLGRKTFEIFASYWPTHEKEWPGINGVKKYVVSKTMQKSEWNNSVFLRDIEEVKKIKQEKGTDLQVHGSGELIKALLKNDLADELWLKTFPVILGKGKRLFGSDAVPKAFTLIESTVSPNGVIFANYRKDGDVKTGSF